MGFFSGVLNGIHHFQDAVKAGADFNPLLEQVMTEIEQLHADGKLDGVIWQAEQSYEQEHGAYVAKGTHTDAGDSKKDVAALRHFISALSSATDMPDALREKAGKLVDMKKAMEDALGPIGKLL